MAGSRKTPGDVGKRARASALRRARASLARLVPDEGERDVFAEGVDRYADAVALAAKLRAEWLELDEPSLELGSMRQPIPHPLIKMIAEADRDAARYAVAVGLDASARVKRSGAGGRPVGSASAPDRKSSVPPRLRMVKAS